MPSAPAPIDRDPDDRPVLLVQGAENPAPIAPENRVDPSRRPGNRAAGRNERAGHRLGTARVKGPRHAVAARSAPQLRIERRADRRGVCVVLVMGVHRTTGDVVPTQAGRQAGRFKESILTQRESP